MTSIIDPIGQHTTMAYDALNRLTTMTDASNRSVTYAYDAASREVSLPTAPNPTAKIAEACLVTRQSGPLLETAPRRAYH